MSEEPRFADTARRLASLAALSLGWTPDTFWNATPEDLATIFAPATDGTAAPLSRTETERLMKDLTDG